MAVKYLLILGIGHLIGDFYWQNKKNKVSLHLLGYCFAFLLTILPIFSIDMVLAAIYAVLIHLAIESVKAVCIKKTKQNGYTIFLFAQFAHFIAFFMLAYIMDIWNFTIGYVAIVKNIFNLFGIDAEMAARWTFAMLFIHVPVNCLIQNFLGEYKTESDGILIKPDNKVGRRIGTIERFIMLLFLSQDQYTAIGFVLTAKSIARYDKITKDEKFAEYYLLGTLMSALCVIVCRIIVL